MRKRIHERMFVKRKPWPAATEAQRQLLAPIARKLAKRIADGEKPPQYLLKALQRFAKVERDRWDRIIAHNEVVKLANSGEILSRSSGIFEKAGKGIGRSAAWVEAAYYDPNPKK